MVRIGIVGIGFMGYTHFEGARGSQRSQGHRDRHPRHEKARRRLDHDPGQLWPARRPGRLVEGQRYADYRELLADPEIDLVDICLPTDLHETAVLESIAAGKPTFVEKPIAVDLKAADRMVKAAKKARRPADGRPCAPVLSRISLRAANASAGGKYGRLLAAHFRRVIAPPKWSRHIEELSQAGGLGHRPAHSRQPLHPRVLRPAAKGLLARDRFRRLREPCAHSIRLSRCATGRQLRERRHRRRRACSSSMASSCI